jgi:hypothetical protein
MKKLTKYFLYIFHFDLIDFRINTDEEGVVHNDICVRQVPRNAMGNVLICRMTQEIAAKEVPGLDAVVLGDVVYSIHFCLGRGRAKLSA